MDDKEIVRLQNSPPVKGWYDVSTTNYLSDMQEKESSKLSKFKSYLNNLFGKKENLETKTNEDNDVSNAYTISIPGTHNYLNTLAFDVSNYIQSIKPEMKVGTDNFNRVRDFVYTSITDILDENSAEKLVVEKNKNKNIYNSTIDSVANKILSNFGGNYQLVA